MKLRQFCDIYLIAMIVEGKQLKGYVQLCKLSRIQVKTC